MNKCNLRRSKRQARQSIFYQTDFDRATLASYNVNMAGFIYKKERLGIGESDYAIRFTPSHESVYAKDKGHKEFKTDFAVNKAAYETLLAGEIISRAQYLTF